MRRKKVPSHWSTGSVWKCLNKCWRWKLQLWIGPWRAYKLLRQCFGQSGVIHQIEVKMTLFHPNYMYFETLTTLNFEWQVDQTTCTNQSTCIELKTTTCSLTQVHVLAKLFKFSRSKHAFRAFTQWAPTKLSKYMYLTMTKSQSTCSLLTGELSTMSNRSILTSDHHFESTCTLRFLVENFSMFTDCTYKNEFAKSGQKRPSFAI